MTSPDVAAFSARRIAELTTASPDQVRYPTPEQERVIEHPLEGTALVLAGAGSGKTETIANRVVWLIANGKVQPDEVLGLTFTRKAAGELSERVQLRLEQFAMRLLNEAELGRLSEQESKHAQTLHEAGGTALLLPRVSTYDAFAASIVHDYGGLAGFGADTTLIDHAAAWGIARETLARSTEPGLLTTTDLLSGLAAQVVALDQEISDHQTTCARVARIAQEFVDIRNLPYNEKENPSQRRGKVYADIAKYTGDVEHTALIAKLAESFALRKRELGVTQFSDQLRMALETVQKVPEAAEAIRSHTRVVLLDEVQDTSVGQGRLLAEIFRGEPVMAVGDPNQSIYGWRGASASGMTSFHRDFQGDRDASGSRDQAVTLTLSVSWRNPHRILQAANTVVQPLRSEAVLDVRELSASPSAQSGTLDWVYVETLHEERELLAEWLQQQRNEHEKTTGAPATAAVILRKRTHMASISRELTKRGIPNIIVGVGGLLTTPEVTDIVATLRCLWYADAGSELIRLLAGPRFRIGVADLAGLRSAARWFEKRDYTQQPLSDDDTSADDALMHPDRRFTILDAIDELASASNTDHVAFQHISDGGKSRLKDAGLMLKHLRQKVADGIPALIRSIERELRLDIELAAAEHRSSDGGAVARANIDAFTAQVENFLAIDEEGTLASLLGWLEQAERDDELAEHSPTPQPGTVQILTVHGAKGLEWDVVALPRMVSSEFPAAPAEGAGWLRKGKLPDELRRDQGDRPQLNWRIAATQKELRTDIDTYKAELRDRFLTEERRLIYVAITRSAARLLFSGSFWGGQKNSRAPSEFLLDLEAAGLIEGLPQASAYDVDPRADEPATLEWPMDPLGNRSHAVHNAATEVLEAYEAAAKVDHGELEIDPIVTLLLEEKRLHTATVSDGAEAAPELAQRLTASSFHEFIADPQQAERNRRRPLPSRPYRGTRLGNEFHDWVEQRTTTEIGTALPLVGVDWESLSIGDSETDVETSEQASEAESLATLQQKFERSRWADRQPLAVELELTIPFAGRRMVCKLDAVYRSVENGIERYEIVDWKSGTAPRTEHERDSRFLQLDLYRHAYAAWSGVDPNQIDVTLFYVAQEQELRGKHQRSLSELEALWLEAARNAATE